MILLPFKIPEKLEIDKETLRRDYGKLVLMPLERGYGATIGHAVKRVLLSSIQGAAVSSIKIDGVLHEFSTLKGLKEDIAFIIMNLKNISFKIVDGRSAKVTVNLKGPKIFKAKDIEEASGGEVKVYNPDHVIAHLNKEADFTMEINLRVGRGYVTADENRNEDDPIGTIPVDSIFTPVKNVQYYVEDTRVGDRTDYEKLVMEIKTDASVTPEEAFTYAGEILKKHINMFIRFEIEEDENNVEEEDPELKKRKDLLEMPIDELELSVRSHNCLSEAKIKLISDLVIKKESEMLKFRNFGKKSLGELKRVLNSKGLEFGMDLEDFLQSK